MEFKDRAGGDEIDQSTSTMAENQLIHTNQRLRKQLYEIESALTESQSVNLASVKKQRTIEKTDCWQYLGPV